MILIAHREQQSTAQMVRVRPNCDCFPTNGMSFCGGLTDISGHQVVFFYGHALWFLVLDAEPKVSQSSSIC